MKEQIIKDFYKSIEWAEVVDACTDLTEKQLIALEEQKFREFIERNR